MLSVSSVHDSFESFLKDTTLPVYQAFRKDEKSPFCKREAYGRHWFSCDVSDKEWTDLRGQIEDAKQFLKSYGDELTRLAAEHRIEDMHFDFPFSCRIGPDVFMQGEYFPALFLELVAKHHIAIMLSHYPRIETQEDDGSDQHMQQAE